MSYCRWSTDDFKCDIYAYESVGDIWVIHVAGNRPVGEIPGLPPLFPPDATDEQKGAWSKAYAEAHQRQMAFLLDCRREAIDLPYAGETFDCATLQEFKAKMLELREIGYRFPDRALQTIDEELANAGS